MKKLIVTIISIASIIGSSGVMAQEIQENQETQETQVTATAIDDFVSGVGPIDYDAGYSVTNIRSYAFAECRQLMTFRAENAVKIGKGVFLGCINLKSVEFPSLTEVVNSGNIFTGCIKLESVRLPLMTIEQAKACGFPWQVPAKAVVFYLKDGTFDKNGKPL